VAEGTPDELKAVHDAGSLDEVFLALTEPSTDEETGTTQDKENVR